MTQYPTRSSNTSPSSLFGPSYSQRSCIQPRRQLLRKWYSPHYAASILTIAQYEELAKLTFQQNDPNGTTVPPLDTPGRLLDQTEEEHVSVASSAEADVAVTSENPKSTSASQTLASPSAEDWTRWRNVVFIARERLRVAHPQQPTSFLAPDPSSPSQLTVEEALAEISRYDREEPNFNIGTYPGTQDPRYCGGCCGSLPPEPRPEEMSIFLHAMRYEMSLGTFESELPEWASPGWKWDRT